MLVGQKLGPFAIEKELGSGAMGAVYLGRYTKTGQMVAVKVMAPGIGSTNPNAAARFEREASILKQFNHPNIVRLFGVGKSHGTRYYAMEYIEGESLDRIMSRRSRMTWEEVVTLGQQLCAALHHAHQQGVVHRDLKPSNLMILKDGTLKLTDFGIAKDMDVTRLTSANCTVGTAAYMSPEQCRGDPDLTHKSDLYSLGVVFYELATGRKPFEAENAMDMFMQHVQGTFERPSRRVLDMPVWLDVLICQLLEKKPELRPLDASTVYASLGKIQEKVEAQLSAGVDAAKMRVIDRPHGAPPVDETDRQMARTLLTGKSRKVRRRKRQRFYERGWFVAAGLLVLAAALGTVLFLVLGPPSPEKLYEQADQLMASKNSEDHEKAFEGPIKTYLAHYANRPGDQTEKIKSWNADAQVKQCQDLIDRYVSKKGSALKFEAQDDSQKAAFKAVDDELDGNLADAKSRWEKIQEALGSDPWGLTAGRHVAELNDVDNREKEWMELWKKMYFKDQEPAKLSPVERKMFRAYRAEHFAGHISEVVPDGADLPAAYRIYQDVKEEAQKERDQRTWLLLAAKKVKELKSKLPADEKKTAEHRREVVAGAVEFAKKSKVDAQRAACLTALDVVAVYGEDYPELEKYVQSAKQLIDEIRALRGNK
jgi:serine/threonine-protein kinase